MDKKLQIRNNAVESAKNLFENYFDELDKLNKKKMKDISLLIEIFIDNLIDNFIKHTGEQKEVYDSDSDSDYNIKKVETSFFKDEENKNEFTLEKCVTSQGNLTNRFVIP